MFYVIPVAASQRRVTNLRAEKEWYILKLAILRRTHLGRAETITCSQVEKMAAHCEPVAIAKVKRVPSSGFLNNARHIWN